MYPDEAWKFIHDYYGRNMPSEIDKNAFVEASEYLIRSGEGDPEDLDIVMYNLASFYYDEDAFSMAKKYFERLLDQNTSSKYLAKTQLGYLWYYGHTGQKSLHKAWEYVCDAPNYDLSGRCLKMAVIWNGVGEDLSVGEYADRIFQLYDDVCERCTERVYSVPMPEVKLLMAELFLARKASDDDLDSAHELAREARAFLFQRLLRSKNPDDLLLMHEIVSNDPFPADEMDYDIYELYGMMDVLDEADVDILYNDKTYEIYFYSHDNNARTIEMNGKAYQSADEFFRKAEIEGMRLNFIADKIHILNW